MICASLVLLQIMFAVHRFAQGATAPAALRVADCLSGNAYKVSVTDSPFCVIWHDTHSADWLATFATKGGTCGMVHEIYDSLFFLSILLVSP